VSSVLVIIAIVSLVVLSVVMAATAIWLIRSNRLEPAPLAPLEMMGEPDWQQADPAERQLILDEVRPDPLREVAREPEMAQDPVPRDPSDPLPVIAPAMFRSRVTDDASSAP
jgi:flagellar basal body-associated protein FliL